MDTTAHNMTTLFEQLGLPAGEQEIAAFLSEHQLPEDVRVSEAHFWNAGQRQFLREEWVEDADWAMVVDALNEALHADASAAARASQQP